MHWNWFIVIWKVEGRGKREKRVISIYIFQIITWIYHFQSSAAFLLPSTLPAELNLLVKLWVFWLCSLLQLANVEKGEGVVDKAMQGPVVTIGVLVHEAGDEVRGYGNDKSLQDRTKYTWGAVRMDTIRWNTAPLAEILLPLGLPI